MTSDSDGSTSDREDEHGHLIDEDGELIYDPRCYGCLAERGPATVTVVCVDIPPGREQP